MTLALLSAYLLTVAVDYALDLINLRHLRCHGSEVPPGFAQAIDAETLRKTTAYTLEKSRLALAESLLDSLLLLLFLFGGLIGVYDRWIASLSSSFIGSGVLFFLLLALAQALLDIPFNLYGTFRIENRYGFNTMTPGLWLADLLKSTAVATVLLSLVTAAAFAIVRFSPGFWWLWVWGFFAAVSIFLMYVSPYVIEPLFFKFKPVKEEGLEDEIRMLMAKAGVQVSRVMQVDASRRSTHSNAYFTGIGRVKRIVLYDTLLAQMTHGEVLAVLAHEVGHWKLGHIRKRLALTELAALAGCWLAYRLTAWGGLPGLLGLPSASFAAQLVILAFLGAIVAFPLAPLSSWLSRRDERQADRFARDLTGQPEALATALIKLSRDNLANLHPHPLYAQFHYSHPPVVERVRELREMAASKPGDGFQETGTAG
jgi:STE24 endopeptidase